MYFYKGWYIFGARIYNTFSYGNFERDMELKFKERHGVYNGLFESASRRDSFSCSGNG